MDRNGASEMDQFEQHELEHAPMIQFNDEMLNKGLQSQLLSPAQHVHVSEDDDFDRKPHPKNESSRWGILGKSLILIPPIAISIVILTLNFKNVFWGLPTTKTNTILGALQFAAQVHASLLVASISMMVLNLIQHGLVSKKGVPLGMISANFYVDSPTWLFRTEFTSLSLKYTLLFPLIVALAVLSAPSSAIAMLPRLQFWTVGNVWLGKDNIKFGVYIQANSSSLYPETLTSSMSAPQCSGQNASTLPECPSYGIRRFMLEQQLFSYPAPRAINITVPGNWNRYMIGHDGLVMQGSNSAYMCSSLSTFLGDVMLRYHEILSSFIPQWIGSYAGKGAMQYEESSLRARYDLSFMSHGKEIPTRKPFVEAQCHGLPANSTSLVLPHDRLFSGNWGSEPIESTVWSIPSSEFSRLSMDLNSTVVNASLIASDAEYFGDIKPSLAAIFATPEIWHRNDDYLETTEPYPFFACTFDARWMKTKTYLEIARPESTVYDSSPDPEVPGYTGVNNVEEVSSVPAYIGESWAKLLNVPWVDSLQNPVPSNRTVLETIGQKCLEEHTFLNSTLLYSKLVDDGKLHYVSLEPMGINTCLQVSLTTYLTDALARAHNTVPVYIDVEGRLADPYFGYPKDVSLSQNLYQDSQYLQSIGSFGKYHANLTTAEFKDATRFTEIRMKMSRYGYGYGFQDSILIYVGTAILLLHALLSVIYIVWVVSRARHPSTDDNTIGKLLVMAMQSGSLGSSGPMEHRNDEKHMKKMWKTKFGLKTVESEQEVERSGDTKKIKTAILERI